ncbi:hypothetical protein ACWPM1_09725 [Tsuneonella sp. HG249]
MEELILPETEFGSPLKGGGWTHEAPEAAFLHRIAAAANECAALIGLPVAIDDDELHAALKAAGHNLTTTARQRLASEVGLHPFPQERWRWHDSELRVVCTAPLDPRPQERWDDCLFLTPQRLLQQEQPA